MVKALPDQDKEEVGEAQRGPPRVRDHIKKLVKHQPMQVCMNCTITFHQTHAGKTPGSNLESAMWSEVCALARTTDRAGRARAPTHAHPVFDDKNSTPTHPAH